MAAPPPLFCPAAGGSGAFFGRAEAAELADATREADIQAEPARNGICDPVAVAIIVGRYLIVLAPRRAFVYSNHCQNFLFLPGSAVTRSRRAFSHWSGVLGGGH